MSSARGKRPRDSQRSAVYAWERSLPGWPGGELSLADCQTLVCHVWEDRAISPAPLVRDGRGRRHACYAPANHQIRLPRWSRSRYVVLHEVAHALLRDRYDLAWHGPEFARLYLDLLYHHAGMDLTRARRLAEHQRPRKVVLARFPEIPSRLEESQRRAPLVADGPDRLLF